MIQVPSDKAINVDGKNFQYNDTILENKEDSVNLTIVRATLEPEDKYVKLPTALADISDHGNSAS